VVPTLYHFETAKQVFAAGVHALVEKPRGIGREDENRHALKE